MVRIYQQWQTDPIIRHYSFSDKRLWGKQEEILKALREHKRVVVRSGNTVGKSFIAADCILDYLTIHQPSKVITTAPTWTQVEGVLWKEIGSAVKTSKIKYGCEILKTELKFNDEWFALGISTNEVHRFQGFHSPHLLIVIDEASGVIPEIWEAVEALHPDRVLAIGNPLENSGNFFDCFSSDLWHKINISCEDCVAWQKENGRIPGLVTQEWINERGYEWGRNSPQYKIHVSGEFPEEGEDSLISRAWVERARKGLNFDGLPLDEENEEDSVKVTAADIATKHGTNETVLCYRYGHTIKHIRGYRQIPVTQSAHLVAMDYVSRKLNVAVIDSDGVGEGVGDILSEKHTPHVEFHGGYGAKAMDDTRFKNLRSQFYWIMAKKFEKGLYNLKSLADKEYEILKNQLCAIKVKPMDALGRIQVETKDDMLARGIRSPDYADAVMMSEYGYFVNNFADVQPYKYL